MMKDKNIYLYVCMPPLFDSYVVANVCHLDSRGGRQKNNLLGDMSPKL